jgi:hypothetical protein
MRSRVRRTNMVKLVASDLIKQAMNAITNENVKEECTNEERGQEQGIAMQQPANASESEDMLERDQAEIEAEIPTVEEGEEVTEMDQDPLDMIEVADYGEEVTWGQRIDCKDES